MEISMFKTSANEYEWYDDVLLKLFGFKICGVWYFKRIQTAIIKLIRYQNDLFWPYCHDNAVLTLPLAK